jgi:hypothetical protein
VRERGVYSISGIGVDGIAGAVELKHPAEAERIPASQN